MTLELGVKEAQCGLPRPRKLSVGFRFVSSFGAAAELPQFSEQQVKNEPMLFSCDRTAAHELGGPLTRAFLDAMLPDWKASEIVVDSRVHMLMPGFWPCIPGWHHDDVPREREDGQPEYVSPSYHAEHCMALVGDASVTEFAVGATFLPDVPLGAVYYREWHPLINEAIEAGELFSMKAPVGRLVYFDSHAFHQGVPATKHGWRWFVRASRNTGRKPANELRRQVQVYLSEPMQGW